MEEKYLLKIQFLIREKGISKKELAKKLQMSERQLYNILEGKGISVKKLEKILTALDTTLEKFFSTKQEFPLKRNDTKALLAGVAFGIMGIALAFFSTDEKEKNITEEKPICNENSQE